MGHTEVGCAWTICQFGKTLVCKYSRAGCQGSDCFGNITNHYTENVRDTAGREPGPCTQRAWDQTILSAQVAKTTQMDDGVPQEMRTLVENPGYVTEFLNRTTVAEILDQSSGIFVPLLESLPPFPPPANAPAPPLGSGSDALTGSEGEDLGWVAAVLLVIIFLLLLLCICPVVVYRVSGGEPAKWCRLTFAHSNPKIALCFVVKDEKKQLKADVEICKKRMAADIASHRSMAKGYWHMREDHKRFMASGEIDAARIDYENGVYEEPYPPAKGTKETSSTATSFANLSAIEQASTTVGGDDPHVADDDEEEVPIEETDEPQIDEELDAEFAEPAEDRARRLEWIKFYVKEGDEEKALDLGWDGKPFKMDAASATAEAPSATSGFKKKAAASKSIVQLSSRVDDLFAEMEDDAAEGAEGEEGDGADRPEAIQE